MTDKKNKRRRVHYGPFFIEEKGRVVKDRVLCGLKNRKTLATLSFGLVDCKNCQKRLAKGEVSEYKYYIGG